MPSSPPTFDLRTHFAGRVARFEAENARVRRRQLGRAGVVFLGDSIVECYRGRLPWVNRGVRGDHLQWPEISVFERLGSDRLHPDPGAIVTLLGINDLQSAPGAVDKHANAYRFLLANLARLYPNARLAVCSLLPTRGAAGGLNPRIVELNQELAGLASVFDAAFLDLHACFLDPGTGTARAGLMAADGIHLSRRGYAELSDCVEAHAAELGTAGDAAFRRRTVRAELARVWGMVRPEATPTAAIDATAQERVADGLLAAYGKACWSHDLATPIDDHTARSRVLFEV